jgi:hypothetical protein
MLHLELIFAQVSLKIDVNVSNVTGFPLLADCLKKEVKIYLLKSVLEELQILCINFVYYKHREPGFVYKVDRFLQLILINVHRKVNNELHILNSNINYSSSESKWLLKNLDTEDGELIKWLFDKLLLEVNDLDATEIHLDKLFISIVETLVLKITDIITYLLLIGLSSNFSILEDNKNGDTLFISSQKNNIYWQSYLKSTLVKPKYVYGGVYTLHIFSSNGICNKLVYLPALRLKEKKYLSTLQFTVIMYLEVFDFLYPKGKWLINKLCRILPVLLK